MSTGSSDRLSMSAEQFNRQTHRQDGERMVRSLVYGLNRLRDSFQQRIHQDVERVIGRDSIMIPVSELKAQMRAGEEIDMFQAAESACAVRTHGYLAGQEEWYLHWLARLRMDQRAEETRVVEALAAYYEQSTDQRRLALMNALDRVQPEGRRAPLVLFRLFPWAVELATALAFGDTHTAQELRRRQLATLPAISDCSDCRGRVLELAENCAVCGNPLWKFEWLTAAD